MEKLRGRAQLAAMLTAITLLAALLTELPFEMDPRFRGIFVTATINGKPAVLLVDTGAASTWLDADVAGVHRFALQRSQFRRDIGFDVRGVVKVAKIELGGRRISRRTGVADLRALSERYNRPIDGVLGQDILGELDRVVIDYNRRVITFE